MNEHFITDRLELQRRFGFHLYQVAISCIFGNEECHVKTTTTDRYTTTERKLVLLLIISTKNNILELNIKMELIILSQKTTHKKLSKNYPKFH